MAWADHLVSTEIDEEQQLEMAEMPAADVANAPRYPWGMRICFDGPLLNKLAEVDPMFAEDPEVGEEVDLDIRVRITGVSRNEQLDGGTDRRVEATIIAIGPEDDDE